MKIIDSIFLHYYEEYYKIFFRRTIVAFICILFLIVILIANIYHLQVVCFESYKTRSNENSIKLIPIAPNRGIIYDRNGTPLALNITIYQLELVPAKVDNLQNTIAELQPIVDLTNDDIANFEKERKHSCCFTALPIKVGLTDIQQARLAVNKYRFSGVEVKCYQRRYYPYGSAFTHVIGYVSTINDHDIDMLYKEGIVSNYAATNHIGKLGIERYYENTLHGKTGYEEVEVNNRGRVIRQLNKQLPQAGKDIILTLDLDLQQYIDKLLTDNRAAVVVLDPRDGSIRALVSNPSYDTNIFFYCSNKYHNMLYYEKSPMINRAIQGIYPPASTVKPYISVSALTIGVINKNFCIFDPGWWQLPSSNKRYRDWKRWGHGIINVTRALEESADTFFYHIAYDMGINRLSDWMKKFGYGQYTGIDLYDERPGVMPNRNWKIKKLKKKWYQGDTIPVGIGQGYWTATPIQMAKALITLINNGDVRTPHLLSTIQNCMYYNDTNHNHVGNHTSCYWKIAKDGMFGVANRPNGTVSKILYDAPYKAAAKSGTAQVYSFKYHETYKENKISDRLRDHKLMTAFAPYDKPTVSIVVILENCGLGIAVDTITRQIMDYVIL